MTCINRQELIVICNTSVLMSPFIRVNSGINAAHVNASKAICLLIYAFYSFLVGERAVRLHCRDV